jgi:hypothetical protein
MGGFREVRSFPGSECEFASAVVRKNSIRLFSSNVTMLHADRSEVAGVSFFILTVGDFKGVHSAWHFWLGTGLKPMFSVGSSFLDTMRIGGTAERVTNFVQVFRNQSGGIAERDLKNGPKSALSYLFSCVWRRERDSGS